MKRNAKALFVAWDMGLDDIVCEQIYETTSENVNHFDCFGSPESGCEACLRHEDCKDSFGDLRGVIVIEKEIAIDSILR